MWARARPSSLFGLICSLLCLYPVVSTSCPNYEKTLNQVKSTPETEWLQSFISQQGLETSYLMEACKMTEYVPTVEDLKKLSQVAFLQNVSQNLHTVVQKLEVLNDSVTRRMALSIEGLDNNICCLLQNLPTGPAACPQSRSKGTPQTSLSFLQKLEGCKIIYWYQSFRKTVKKVIETWDVAPEQRNRNRRSLLSKLIRAD